jgi:hypothetical protein
VPHPDNLHGDMTSIVITNTRGGQAVIKSGRVPIVIVGIGLVLVGGRTGG